MFRYAKAIGANTDVSTAQAFLFPQEGQTQIWVILISAAGEDVFARVRRTGLSCEERLASGQATVSEQFQSLATFIKTELSNLEQVKAGIGLFREDTLYLQTINDFSILLLRNGSLIELAKPLAGEKFISGVLEDGDQVLFITPPQGQSAGSDWRQALAGNLFKAGVENLEYEIEIFLQQLPHSDPIAVALVEKFRPAEEAAGQEEAGTEDWYKEPLLKVGSPERARFYLLTVISFYKDRVLGVLRRKTRRQLFTIFVLVSLLFLGLFTLVKNEVSQNRSFDQKLALARNDFAQAQLKKDSDPSAARQSLLQARSELGAALKIRPKDSQALALKKEMDEQSFTILRTYEVSEFAPVLDLNLIKQGFQAASISSSQNKALLLDKSTKTLILVDLEQKKPQILAGQMQLGDAQFATINGDKIYVYSKDKGILKVSQDTGKIIQVIKPDPEWLRIADLYGFAANVYLLDEFKNQVWKYIGTDNGFSERRSYLKSDTKADFAAARKLQIDGAVWVLRSDNKILKFVQGGEDFYSLSGFGTPINYLKSFYVSDETESVYLLDNDHSRVVLTKKNGEYLSEYDGDKFKTADDLIVDEKNKKLYLLESNKLYLVGLK